MKFAAIALAILMGGTKCLALTPMTINTWSLSAWADGPVEGTMYGGYSSGTATTSGDGPGNVSISSTGTDTDNPNNYTTSNATASFIATTGIGGMVYEPSGSGTWIGNVEINAQLPDKGFAGSVSASVTFTIPYDSMLAYTVTNTDPSYATITTSPIFQNTGNGQFFDYGGPVTFTISDNQPHVGSYSGGDIDITAEAIELPEPAALGLIPAAAILLARRKGAVTA